MNKLKNLNSDKGRFSLQEYFRLGDKVKVGSRDECADAMKGIEKALQETVRWISMHVTRTDKSVALANLLDATAKYLSSAALNIEGHISIVALCTRNIYEINLQVRDLILSPSGLQRWLGESVTDKIDLLDGILSIGSASDTSKERQIVLKEIERLRLLRDKYSLPSAKPSPAGQIAKSVGLSEDHKALFKLFSKLVHPSSFLVNDFGNAASKEHYYILQIHAQIYAWDTFSRVCEDASMPDEIRQKIERANIPHKFIPPSGIGAL